MLTFKRIIFYSFQLYLIALLILFKTTLKNEYKQCTQTGFSKRGCVFPPNISNVRRKWKPHFIMFFVFLLGWTWRHYTSGQLTEGVSPHPYSDWSRLLLYDWLLLCCFSNRIATACKRVLTANRGAECGFYGCVKNTAVREEGAVGHLE